MRSEWRSKLERPSCTRNIHPLAELRAGPPGDALLSRCFLVTSLHQQRSDPLSEGQRKLCSGQQRSDPLGLRPSGSSCVESHQDQAWPSGSFALVSKEVTRSACGRAEALALKVIKTKRGQAEALLWSAKK